MFLDRQNELSELENIWQNDKANFVVVYGRRRVGKSSLLKEFSQTKNVFYWTATKTTSQRLLQSFSKELYNFKNPQAEISDDFSYPNWSAAILDLTDLAKNSRLLAVIDEFPYAIDAEPELPSLIQKIWDNNLSRTKVVLVATGSRIGMIEKHILSSNGPLYGRATAVMWLEPLPLSALQQFLPGYSLSQLVEVYSITGGIPSYLNLFDGSAPVLETINKELKSSTSILRGEPYFLIHEELKEPMRYVAILEAIGGGKTMQAEIAKNIGIEKTHIMPYLSVLENLRFIKRSVPVTVDPKSSRKGRYNIVDLFLKFYFRFIAPNVNWIEEGRGEKVFNLIAANWDSFVGQSGFEEICRRWLTRQAQNSKLPFDPDVIGKYWDAKIEVDVAAVSKKHHSMIIGEVKWTGAPCGLSVLEELNRKAKHLVGEFGWHINKILFSRSGFGDDLIERAKVENARLVTLEELFQY